MILLDYNSLLISLGFCSAGLVLTFFVSWFVSQSDRVLITWGLGTSFLVVGVLAYSLFISRFSAAGGALAFATLLIGMVVFWGGAHQFSTGVLPVSKMGLIAAATIAITSVPMFQGYDGLCYIVFNLAAMALLFATAREFWRWRREAPLLIVTVCGLYVLTGLSFLLCTVPLISDGSWIMHHAPANWAENVNLVVSLTAVAGIGALSLGLNQVRLARRHERDAETDPLTGLFNRRALITRASGLQASVALLIFDIDHFKQVNDVHGHQAGDIVLQAFAQILLGTVREGDVVARLGGEEFAALLPDASLKAALIVAERVRKQFAERRFKSVDRYFSSSVSAGVSLVGDNTQLEDLMIQADAALYNAKRAGRDRVVLYSDRSPATQPNVDLYNAIARTARRPSLRQSPLRRQ
ncbi:MAG TPA: GGDEF domain-containing protein [Lacipirellulaceae bacterium]|nr:GGDEF domain-containing protein [Lacipirellulaceae bacterium]